MATVEDQDEFAQWMEDVGGLYILEEDVPRGLELQVLMEITFCGRPVAEDQLELGIAQLFKHAVSIRQKHNKDDDDLWKVMWESGFWQNAKYASSQDLKTVLEFYSTGLQKTILNDSYVDFEARPDYHGCTSMVIGIAEWLWIVKHIEHTLFLTETAKGYPRGDDDDTLPCKRCKTEMAEEKAKLDEKTEKELRCLRDRLQSAIAEQTTLISERDEAIGGCRIAQTRLHTREGIIDEVESQLKGAHEKRVKAESDLRVAKERGTQQVRELEDAISKRDATIRALQWQVSNQVQNEAQEAKLAKKRKTR
ncbi:hypothetical protein M426DRAFT_13972 [Hypoxylon sp. CI-4A]|nr:hypothetical protein M426DRAFT_13972 [Hypoxylon sp. CI-4A]